MEDVESAPLGHGVERGPILGVVITDPMFGFFTEGRGLAQLLRHPGVGRMGRRVDIDDPPLPQMDDDKCIEGLEE